MDSHWGERFTVEVRLIPESGLWSWEIWDTVRGEVAASSWVRDWTAYESREAALRAGQFQLTLGYPFTSGEKPLAYAGAGVTADR